jgi:hypothetical protein
MENEKDLIKLFEITLKFDKKTKCHGVEGGFLERPDECNPVVLLPILIDLSETLNALSFQALGIAKTILKGISEVEENIPSEIKEKMQELQKEYEKSKTEKGVKH